MTEHKVHVAEWNDKHCELVNSRNNFMANYCEVKIKAAKKDYYAGNPTMSDQTYDWYENNLKILRPNSSVLKKVGTSDEDLL